MKWILLAFLIAGPVAWYVMRGRLSSSAYRMGLDGWIFIASGGFASLIALLTVGWQSFKAAVTNPVNSLKNE